MELRASRAFQTFVLPAVLLLASACQTAQNLHSATLEDWRVAGASNALIASRDGGDFGESTTIRAGISGGKFFSESTMFEGIVTFEDSNVENSVGDDTDTHAFTFGAGLRHYFDTVSASRPYASVQCGFAHVDADEDVSGIHDSDTAPFLRAGAGLESFLSDSVAIDFGIVYERIFDLELSGLSDDISTFAGMIGISVWL